MYYFAKDSFSVSLQHFNYRKFLLLNVGFFLPLAFETAFIILKIFLVVVIIHVCDVFRIAKADFLENFCDFHFPRPFILNLIFFRAIYRGSFDTFAKFVKLIY